MTKEQKKQMEIEIQRCIKEGKIYPNDGAKPEGFRLGYEIALSLFCVSNCTICELETNYKSLCESCYTKEGTTAC